MLLSDIYSKQEVREFNNFVFCVENDPHKMLIGVVLNTDGSRLNMSTEASESEICL